MYKIITIGQRKLLDAICDAAIDAQHRDEILQTAYIEFGIQGHRVMQSRLKDAFMNALIAERRVYILKT